MKIEWTQRAPDWHTGNAGKLFEVELTGSGDEWLASVTAVSRDGSSEIDYDQALRPTIDEAKAAAQEIVDYALAPFVATARTEAALAEREACVSDVVRVLCDVFGEKSTSYALAIVDAIHARTTPATLSTDTLAAPAEARGFRLVAPEYLAELEALRAAVDKLRGLKPQTQCLTCDGDGLDPETTCDEGVNDLDDAAITCSDCGGTGALTSDGKEVAK